MAPLVILHIPHASTYVPADIRETFLVSEAELNKELLLLTDAYTDELFGIEHSNVKTVLFRLSRLVIDPERFTDDKREPMAAVGMGVVYTRTSSGHSLRVELSTADREGLLSTYYRPHHKKLSGAVADALDVHGRCLILDCHSFSSTPLPHEPDQDPERPDICIGTDPVHTPTWLGELVVGRFREQGYDVEVNHPFAGSIVPEVYFQKNSNVHSVMIEINRRLYMDETTGARNRDYGCFKQELAAILHAIVDVGTGGTSYSPPVKSVLDL
jgi:N-formylglutamate amidohydrolase